MLSLPQSKVFPEFAPDLGLTLSPATTQVLDEFAPDFGFSSFPLQTHVFDEFAPDFGLISLPSNTQVLDELAPDLGFSSLPSQFQFDGRDILFAISHSLLRLASNSGTRRIRVSTALSIGSIAAS